MGYNEARPQPRDRFARLREEFPVCDNLIYLNHAAVAPLCRPAANAMQGFIRDARDFGSIHYSDWLACYAGLRTAAAKLIGAKPEEIAIVKNTSEGISTVMLGFDWKPGERVIAFKEEFPANYFPWNRLQARGVEITLLSIYDPIDVIAAAIPGARLLAISFVNYVSGYRVDLNAIGRLCAEHGCFFFVDAIQGLGAYPLNVNASHIDALAADGHKWLLGPEGNGILFIRREWQDRIEPAEFGWSNTAKYWEYNLSNQDLRPDAGRYECGTLNTIGCFGLRAAIEFILEIGVENITPAVDALAQQIEDGVGAKGYQALVRRTPSTGSGIVAFRHPSIDAHSIAKMLEEEKILVASRQGWVRTAPHFYISSEEINRMLDLLP